MIEVSVNSLDRQVHTELWTFRPSTVPDQLFSFLKWGPPIHTDPICQSWWNVKGNKISYNFLQKTAYSFHKKFFLFNCVFNHSLRSPRVRSNHSLTSTWQLLYKPNRMINMSSSCFHHSGHHSIFCYILEYYAVVLRINASGTSSKTMTSDHIFLEKTNSRSFSEKTPAIAGCCSSIRPKRAIVSSNIFFLQFALASHLIGQVVTIRHGTGHNHFFGYILPLPQNNCHPKLAQMYRDVVDAVYYHVCRKILVHKVTSSFAHTESKVANIIISYFSTQYHFRLNT